MWLMLLRSCRWPHRFSAVADDRQPPAAPPGCKHLPGRRLAVGAAVAEAHLAGGGTAS